MVESSVSSEYVMTFPVPQPSSPGKYLLMSLSPEGRTSAAFVDRVKVGWRVVAGRLGRKTVMAFPAKQPWLLLDRDLLRFMTKEEANKRAAEACSSLLDKMRESGVALATLDDEPHEPESGRGYL